MATMRTRLRAIGGYRRRRPSAFWLLPPAFLLAGIAGGVLLGTGPGLSLSRFIDAPPAASTSPTVSRQFPICAGGVRVTCVVDGDTFWLDGVKIRVADIDTPEIGQPGCAAEAALGRRATTRMRELLSAGPFELAPADRDEDRYGRKLRLAMRDGQSLGEVLVAEGLAHRWEGRQHEWC